MTFELDCDCNVVIILSLIKIGRSLNLRWILLRVGIKKGRRLKRGLDGEKRNDRRMVMWIAASRFA